MAHTPLKMTIEEAHAEVRHAWDQSYSPEAIAAAVDSMSERPLSCRITLFIARLFFRGIYFPQMSKRAWCAVIFQNRGTIYRLMKAGFAQASARRAVRKKSRVALESPPT